MRILKSILFFGVLLFANSHLHAQTKIDLTNNVTDTAGNHAVEVTRTVNVVPEIPTTGDIMVEKIVSKN